MPNINLRKNQPVEPTAKAAVKCTVVESVLITVKFTIDGTKYAVSFSGDVIVLVMTNDYESDSQYLMGSVNDAARAGLLEHLTNTNAMLSGYGAVCV